MRNSQLETVLHEDKRATLEALPDDVLVRVCCLVDERTAYQLSLTSRSLRQALHTHDSFTFRTRAEKWYPAARLVPLHTLTTLTSTKEPPPTWLSLSVRLANSSALLANLLDEYTITAFNNNPDAERCALLEDRILSDPFYTQIEPELLELAAVFPNSRLTHAYLAKKLLRMRNQRRCVACWSGVYANTTWSCLALESSALVLSFWLRRFDFEREALLTTLLSETQWLVNIPLRARVGLLNAALDLTGHQLIRTEAMLREIERLLNHQPSNSTSSSFQQQEQQQQHVVAVERAIFAFVRGDELAMAAEAGQDVLSVISRMAKRVKELLPSVSSPPSASSPSVASLSLLENDANGAVACAGREEVRARLAVVNRVFFDEFGFAACEDGRYYDASNSFLDLVVLQRRGIPITLSVLYAAVARDGAQVRLHAAQVPAHFHLRVDALHLIDMNHHDTDHQQQQQQSQQHQRHEENRASSPAPLYVDVFHGGVLRDEESLWEFLAPMTRHQHVNGADLVHAQAVERHGNDRNNDSTAAAAALLRAEAAARERGVLCRFLNNLYQVYATRTQLDGFGVDMSSLRRTTGSMEGVVLQRYALSGAASNLQVLFSLHVTRRDPDVSAHVLRELAKDAPDFALLERDAQTLESLRQGVFGGGNHVKRRLSSVDTVAYRVGQCIVHRRYAYEGVIVGWDPLCAAPEQWIRSMQVDQLTHGRNQPFYSVLVDCRHRGPDAVTYVAQENIQVAIAPRAVQHTHVPRHFTAFEPSAQHARCYKPNVLLAKLYPDDA